MYLKCSFEHAFIQKFFSGMEHCELLYKCLSIIYCATVQKLREPFYILSYFVKRNILVIVRGKTWGGKGYILHKYTILYYTHF